MYGISLFSMAIEHSYKEYQKRKQKEREVLDRSNDHERHGPRPATQFQPRAVKVKKERESPEMDFKTRMKMMQNSKAAPKKTIFGIKVYFSSDHESIMKCRRVYT